MKKRSLIFAGFMMLLFLDSAFCQLLYNRGKPEMEIENYGRNGYNKYGLSIINRQANPIFDSFGNYIMDGVRAVEWTEEKINSKHMDRSEAYSSMEKANPVDDGEYFREYVNNLVVVHESQKAFSTRFIVGNEVRVKFSPLTVDTVALNGIRWDFKAGHNNLTLISSRADLPIYFGKEYINDQLKYRLIPVYLTGGHVERKMGIFNVAANYVNTYKSNSSLSRYENSVTGTIHHNPPETLMLVVKLEDGSRFDGTGPRIFDMYPIVNGEERKDLLIAITKGSWTTDFTRVRRIYDNPAKDFYENIYMLDPRRIPDYEVFSRVAVGAQPDWFVIPKRKSGEGNELKNFAHIAGDSKKYLGVDGDEYLQFWFEVPTKSKTGETIDVSDVTFRALVGNDYKFSISEIYDAAEGEGGQSATYFYTIKESSGHVKDMSNLKWVTFRHGQETANMIMGFRIDSDVKDFKFAAEYNKNMSFRQFMNTDAHKFRTDAEAYYVNVKKNFGKLSIGTEYFKIDSGYSTTFENVDMAYRHMQTLPDNSWQTHFVDDVSLRGGSPDPQGYQTAKYYMNDTMVIDTVDDNDDKDRFADFHMYSKIRDRNGIFPGLDMNGNSRPDTNENDNTIPDYAEPFFLFNIDPDEYDFGDDFNNNGVIDAREDDDRPDYPYDRGTRGGHIFTSYGEDVGMKYTLGYVNFEEMTGGGTTDVKYGKVHYNKYIPFFADLTFASTFKKVKDTIQDDVFRHERLLSTTLIDSFSYRDNAFRSREGIQHESYYDPLMYLDSYVTTSFFNTKLFYIPNLTIDIKLKYDLNHQNKSSKLSEGNDIVDRVQVYKAQYKYYIRKLLLMPQVKFMSRKLTSQNVLVDRGLHEEYFYPIFRLEYPLTFKTYLRAGAQGFPGLNTKVRNLINSDLDYDSRHYLIMLSNRSLYQGYDISLNFGYEINWQDFNGIMRESYNRTDRVIFIKLIVGQEPIS